jgi:hypothetical protein
MDETPREDQTPTGLRQPPPPAIETPPDVHPAPGQPGAPGERPQRVVPLRTILIAGGAVLVIAVGVVVALTLLGGSDSAVQLPARHDVTGTLTASECGGGYDIEFASVSVRNEADKLIGSGSTGGDESTIGGCEVTFTIEDVPRADFYQVEIGTHGGPSYSYAEMQQANWDLQLSL